MRKLIVLTMFFLFISAAAHGEIIEKYDRFTKKTTVNTKPEARCFFKGRPFLVLNAEFKNKPIYFQIMFTTMQDGWEYLRCHTTHILADDVPVKIPDATHTGDVQSGGDVIEFICINLISLKSLDQLCKAKKIEVKICNDVFELDDEEKQDLKDFRTILNKKLAK
ncbi:hypothetical protein ES705_13255 [subsurface metagenome]